MLYSMKVNAWMGEHVMMFWVENILKPYIESIPEHIIPILFLDSYRSHIMRSIINVIHELSCKVQHIPGGGTGLCLMLASTSLSSHASYRAG
jgi:hypothetical protein